MQIKIYIYFNVNIQDFRCEISFFFMLGQKFNLCNILTYVIGFYCVRLINKSDFKFQLYKYLN